jgi:hypothetical protein
MQPISPTPSRSQESTFGSSFNNEFKAKMGSFSANLKDDIA